MTIEESRIVSDYISKNVERFALLNRVYNPVTGEGCDSCERTSFNVPDIGICNQLIPSDCFEEKIIRDLQSVGSARAYLKALGLGYTKANVLLVKREYIKARCIHDFEFTAASFFYIKDKNPENKKDILFILNPAQRILLKAFYADLKAGLPVRVIIDKARQMGFSTLTQLFILWLQLFKLKVARSEIIAHVENTSRTVQGMVTKVISKLPPWVIGLDNIEKLRLSPFEKSSKTRMINELGMRITVGSAAKPDNLAGDDITLAHFSEVALYPATKEIKPEQLIESVIGGLAYVANTMVVYESTARGVGDFFHREWLAAISKESHFTPVFVPWFKMPSYTKPIDDPTRFILSMSSYEKWMFDKGATLEGINWYREASKSMRDKWRWRSEYPTTWEESFQSTGHRLYPQDDVIRLRKGCRAPVFVGDIYGKKAFGEEAMADITFKEERDGALKVWFMPDQEPAHRCNDRYVVVMDIGGCSDHSDRSVICVIDRYDMTHGGVPIVVAEWCGHIDHDLLAWKAVQLATAYDNALLVIESNTLETEQTEGDHFDFILDEIAYYYDNLYCRVDAEKIKMGFEPKWGFHTNKSTKRMVCDHQKKALRENMYIETCIEACDEHDFMEIKSNGNLGAVDGQHDDRHITRAIGIWVSYDYLNPPRKIEPRPVALTNKPRVINESTI